MWLCVACAVGWHTLGSQVALLDLFTAMTLYLSGDIRDRLRLSFTLFDEDGNGQLDRVRGLAVLE